MQREEGCCGDFGQRIQLISYAAAFAPMFSAMLTQSGPGVTTISGPT